MILSVLLVFERSVKIVTAYPWMIRIWIIIWRRSSRHCIRQRPGVVNTVGLWLSNDIDRSWVWSMQNIQYSLLRYCVLSRTCCTVVFAFMWISKSTMVSAKMTQTQRFHIGTNDDHCYLRTMPSFGTHV